MNKFTDTQPIGDMVHCIVVDAYCNRAIALWGNSGAPGETSSFFQPHGGKFTASEIVWWEYYECCDVEYEATFESINVGEVEAVEAPDTEDATPPIKPKRRSWGFDFYHV